MARSIILPLALLLFSAACDTRDTAPPPVSFAAHDGAFFRVQNGVEMPFPLHAVNLGVGVPGTQPGELAVTRDQYDRWLARMREAGFNAVRIYTLHYPRFYEALRDHNTTHPDAPLYLLHGIWLDEENPSYDLHGLTEAFERNIEEAVAASHGDIAIPERYGRAFGTYTADVSPWIAAWIIGREIAPIEVAATDAAHPDDTAHDGDRIALPHGSPTESWLAARLDRLATLEQDRYGAARPLSVSSWPTLDPLSHPTENSQSFEDTNAVDLAGIDTTNHPPGYFASYHAYPYYPDFMSEDPAYTEETDAEGPNSYLGYLKALRAHYHPIPLFIAEFGVPSSWGSAHVAQSGMHHGGHDETTQGRYAVRMFRNIAAAGCIGGALFAWSDEWWKNSWVTEEIDLPIDRRPLWLNITAPEENYGLIAFDDAPPVMGEAATEGTPGPVDGLLWAASNRFFHLEIATEPAALPIVVGFDTYRDDAGETVLPDGTVTAERSEFALVIDGSGAQLFVTESYDLFGIWHDESSDAQQYRSTATDGAPWMPVRWLSNTAHGSDDGTYQFPATVDEVGRLVISPEDDFTTPREGVAMATDRVRIRVPWTLLQFTDPSRAIVMDDDRETYERETAESDGIRVVIAQGDGLLTTDRLLWDLWDTAPVTTEREKDSLGIVENYLRALPASGPE